METMANTHKHLQKNKTPVVMTVAPLLKLPSDHKAIKKFAQFDQQIVTLKKFPELCLRNIVIWIFNGLLLNLNNKFQSFSCMSCLNGNIKRH